MFKLSCCCLLGHTALLCAVLSPTIALSQEPGNARVETHTYKRVGDLEIKLDIHRPPASADGERDAKGLVVWIHGGALINGGRLGINRRNKQDILAAGYPIVSIDYRLAPETKLPQMIADVEDAFGWLRKEGQRLGLNTSRIVVIGGSAGGYLTLVTGYRVQPRPAALVVFWGYGDLLDDGLIKPNSHPRYRRNPLSREKAFEQVSGPPIANSANRQGDGRVFYRYTRWAGVWPQAVTGWDPHRQPEKFVPFMPVRNVTKDYPPTLLIHGKLDSDVRHQQAVMMAQQLKKHGVEHRLISIENGEHGLVGAEPQKIEKAYQAAEQFAKRHLRK